MRPYQIVACEKILNKIKYAENNNLYGKIEAGGYIWHTTGSGKTLTSFKTSILATKTGYIDKVFFVVDRKDLDSQTIKEYNNFQEGCVSSNKSTKVLQEQIERDDPIIVTTIQKLSNFVKSNKSHHIFNKKVVIIFDECHRSQFGDMHSNITKNFKKYCLFGFTGTPIFEKNAPKLKGKTTLQLFGDKLHTYTIVDAINDGTVLPFKMEYFDTVKAKDNIEDKKVHNINTEEVLLNETRIKGIVKHIIDSFNDKTKDKRFNSILAVSSIPAAIKYYKAFQEILKAKETDLKVATIFTYNPNEEDEGYIDDESFDTDGLDTSSRDFLEGAIKDYNNMFQTSFDTSGKNFENYYEDISRRLKKKELDLLIVVNMFLTGFDAKTLNTLWVDKNLKYHSLIQAFSRTNRILNSVKTFGNIICYRNLKENLQAAIGLFGDKNAESIIVLRDYKSYLNGYEEDGEYKKGYLDYVDELYNKFPLDEEIISEERQKEFIALYNTLLKFRNILTTFEEFKKDDPFNKEDKQVDLDDYQAKYINIYTKTRKREDKQKESILGDVVFEIELIEDVEVNVDYILKMVIEYKLAGKNDNARLSIIINKIKSSLKLYDKVELIEEFISKINIASVEEGYSAWKSFTTENKEKELMKIIKEENLKEKETIDYMKNAFNDGVFRTNGVDFDGLLPNISRFSKENNRMEKTNMVTQKLTDFFNKYYNIM